jgi:hypothetical protein
MSVICVGGFRQLKPVWDNYIFCKGKLVVLHELSSTLGNFLHVFVKRNYASYWQ